MWHLNIPGLKFKMKQGQSARTLMGWSGWPLLLGLAGSGYCAEAAVGESDGLSFRPTRTLFYEGLQQQASPYGLISSLPSHQGGRVAGETFPGAHLFDPTQSGASDSRLNWLQWSGDRHRVVFGASYAESPASSTYSSGTLTPLAISFLAQPDSLLFVPSYHDGMNRAEETVMERERTGYLDLYLSYLPPGGMRWLSIDPSVQRDFQTGYTTYSFEFEAGHVISSMFGSGGIYARPGVDIRNDKASDWNLEVGIHINY